MSSHGARLLSDEEKRLEPLIDEAVAAALKASDEGTLGLFQRKPATKEERWKEEDPCETQSAARPECAYSHSDVTWRYRHHRRRRQNLCSDAKGGAAFTACAA